MYAVVLTRWCINRRKVDVCIEKNAKGKTKHQWGNQGLASHSQTVYRQMVRWNEEQKAGCCYQPSIYAYVVLFHIYDAFEEERNAFKPESPECCYKQRSSSSDRNEECKGIDYSIITCQTLSCLLTTNEDLYSILKASIVCIFVCFLF